MTKKFLLLACASIFFVAINCFSQGFDSLYSNVGTNKALIFTPVANYGHKIYGFDASARTDLRFAVRANTPIWTDIMSITSAGNVGIGNIAPSQKLVVNGNIMLGLGNAIGMALADSTTYDGKYLPNYGVEWVSDSWNSWGPTMWAGGFAGIKLFTNRLPRFSINVDGNVGIGTTNPGSNKLAVEGTIAARRVKVTQAAPWPDFVFDSSYQLPSLQEIKNYVTVNKHLPHVPSAKEIEKNGQDLGEMNRVLLQKIEELTLHLIELEEKLDKLEKDKK
ncbi:hypothetical protein SAMN05518672_106197 [Chitinophaga sp. CF118]|uniref:tail fiber protein n=1 Tax=Chitinophaga sp. CF118 TaxID=1884367 RepID=UPI0008F01139|nr:tail fiber protein [Chitinophaga sp. CF118]SFE45911.1 hypothetical protein SAMN05518672_106197 [Chitinophaga sp. CF118]